jgi:hypothetical protein
MLENECGVVQLGVKAGLSENVIREDSQGEDVTDVGANTSLMWHKLRTKSYL